MTILGKVSDLRNYFSEENLLKEHGGTSEYVYSYKKVEN